ncbi:transmembrane protein 25 [Elgaria multicarinata webbii]|uniref:transmembrane protein 25 n=1 Tax=Elgaria multicarinata webbii TaxID=159646 RepID=UPI002FCD3E61
MRREQAPEGSAPRARHARRSTKALGRRRPRPSAAALSPKGGAPGPGARARLAARAGPPPQRIQAGIPQRPAEAAAGSPEPLGAAARQPGRGRPERAARPGREAQPLKAAPRAPRLPGRPSGMAPRSPPPWRLPLLLLLLPPPPPLEARLPAPGEQGPAGRARRPGAGAPPVLPAAGLPAGAAEPAATIDGRALSVSSLQEAESRAFTCLAAAPSLAWYLNGERQETNDSSRLLATAGGGGGAFEENSSSTFVVTARRLDRQLNCSATDPATGRVASASVLLNVQFKPEIVKMDAHYEESREPGLLLVLFVLVQANPPANITWVDQDGQVMVNTSAFLIVDTKTYPWLTNHTVQVQLSSLAQNFSFSAANAVGISNASLPSPGLLDTRIELPLLALVVASAVALGTLLSLGALISCVLYRKGKKAAGIPPPAPLPPSDSNNLKPTTARLPRAIMSLPSNLQLNDLTPESKVNVRPDGPPAEREEEALPEPENHLALAGRGLSPFPMVGYIYRASSMSSDEIWL